MHIRQEKKKTLQTAGQSKPPLQQLLTATTPFYTLLSLSHPFLRGAKEKEHRRNYARLGPARGFEERES